ncbi:MAG TPA: DUF2079 domain-containing protein [Actinomycetota bacterium]|nr:DUF2079 domain-containing protein [Actinomycetota bacterium]
MMVLAFIAVFATLSYRQQLRLGTFGFDLGIFDQGIWLLSRFEEPFVTVRGLNFFGNHLNLTAIFLVPFYWLGAGAGFLNIVQVVAIASGAIPLWLIARQRLGNDWIALPVAAAYLLNPTLEWGAWWGFHPDALALTPFLFAYYFMLRRRWTWFAICVLLILFAKEDTSLTVLALGVFIAVKHDKRVGLLTSLAALVWLLAATKLLIPLANGGEGPFYEDLYGDFGSDIITIGRNIVFNPTQVLDLALEGERVTYFRQLLAPVAFLAVLAPGLLAVIGPQLLANIISVQPYTHQIRYQYSLLITIVIFLATIEAIHRYGSTMGRRRFLVGALAACALASNVTLSPSPLGVQYQEGIWSTVSPAHEVKKEGLALIPDDASVSAVYYLVPQLTHRKEIYEYPNPWSPANWGVRGEGTADPASIEYLAIDTGLLGDDHRARYRSLTGPEGEFRVIWSAAGVEIAKRVRQ